MLSGAWTGKCARARSSGGGLDDDAMRPSQPVWRLQPVSAGTFLLVWRQNRLMSDRGSLTMYVGVSLTPITESERSPATSFADRVPLLQIAEK